MPVFDKSFDTQGRYKRRKRRFAIVEFGSPLSNAEGIISTELSPIRKLNDL